MAQIPLKSIKFPGLPDTYTVDPGLSEEAKAALLACFQHVAWTDEDGQDYYDALESALEYNTQYPKLEVTYTPGGYVAQAGDALSTLKNYLVVKYYATKDSAATTITDYTMSGMLEAGDNEISVSYNALTVSFVAHASGWRIARVSDFETTLGLSDFTIGANGNLEYSEAKTFSLLPFKSSIKRAKFSIPSNSRVYTFYLLAKTNDNKYIITDGVSSGNVSVFECTLKEDGTAYNSTAVQNYGVINRPSSTFIPATIEVYIENGTMYAKYNQSVCFSITNANMIGFWLATWMKTATPPFIINNMQVYIS